MWVDGVSRHNHHYDCVILPLYFQFPPPAIDYTSLFSWRPWNINIEGETREGNDLGEETNSCSGRLMDLSKEELQNLLRAAEQGAEASEKRAEVSERETQNTTLDEYLDGCHQLLFNRLTIETDSDLRSKGSITSPQNKWCPTNLRAWPGFLHRQREAFGLLYDNFPPREERVFESRHFLEILG